MTELRALLLAAGLGSRLRPYTESLPKCLMPIGSRPLLEHWLCTFLKHGVKKVLINTHHHAQLVGQFISRDKFTDWVFGVHEPILLGTAGTIRHNIHHFCNQTTLVVHADNWCQCDFASFLRFHESDRSSSTAITMMTFKTDTPSQCGVVEVDKDGVVIGFHEKVDNPPSNLANGAVYLIEPEVMKWIYQQTSVTDFSTQVIPNYIGRISSWENTHIHRDIGTIESLLKAQKDPLPECCWPDHDDWFRSYRNNPIHSVISSLSGKSE